MARSSNTRHVVPAPRPSSPDSTSDPQGSRPDLKYASVGGYTDSVGGTERVFMSRIGGVIPANATPSRTRHPLQRSPSPTRQRRKRHSISVNKRPYSASGSGAAMLERSPYMACVAPHLHQSHTVKPRPASAKKLLHYV